jgi:trehalose 6-phosphate phosphatase
MAGKKALDNLLGAGALLGFDFDGTLAPIVDNPADARMERDVNRKFGAICGVADVAVVTGRSVADIKMRLGFQPKHLIGSHGAEGLPGSDSCSQQELMAVCDAWVYQLKRALDQRAAIPGLYLEHKTCSVCIHYRHASIVPGITDAISVLLQGLIPAPRMIAGILSVNLIPDGAPLKLQALQTLVAQENVRGAFYIGDEETDELVFRGAPVNWVTVKVGPAQGSAARFHLDDQGQIGACLDLLLDILTKM